MSDTPRTGDSDDRIEAVVSSFREQLSETLDAELDPLSALVQERVRGIADTLSAELTEAAIRGRIDIDALLSSVLEDIARSAANQLVRAPIEGAFASVFGGPNGDALGRSGAQLAQGIGSLFARGNRNA